jgi:hypothetical protein
MNVVVQEMIDSDKAGVLFTASPDNGSAILIEAVSGQGENLVSGQVSAHRYEISRKCYRPCPDDLLSESEVRLLYETGKQVRSTFGGEKDIEWAIRDGRLYLLQMRPITTLGSLPDPDEEAMVRWVLSRHETIEARPMLDVFSAYGDAFAWKLDRESARALARYFDERVPDGADDYRFGDDVVRLVPPLSQMKDHGESINVFFEGIDALGFRVSQAQLNPILALFVDFVNNLPRWCNNGWTSEELYERYGR